MEAALQMPDQLWMLEQEIEFHQGLSGWNKIHGMDNVVFSKRAQTYEKAPQESVFWHRCGQRAWLRIENKATGFYWTFFIF